VNQRRRQRAPKQFKGFNQCKPEVQLETLNAKETECLRTLALNLYRGNKLKQSQDIYQKIIISNHATQIDHCRIASIYLSNNEHEKAIKMLKKALEINPRITSASYNLCKALKDTGELSEAQKYCERALDFDAQDFDLLTLYGNILGRQNKHTEACVQYKKALSISPRKPQAYWNLGKSYQNLKSYHQALECFAAITSMNHNYTQAWIEIGNIAKDKGHAMRSTQYYLKALESDPKNWQAHLNLMSAFHDADRATEALHHGNTALEIAPNHPAVVIHCAQIFNHYCNFSLSHKKARDHVHNLLNDNGSGGENIGVINLFPVESLHHDTTLEDHINYKSIVKGINTKLTHNNNQDPGNTLTLAEQINQLSPLRSGALNEPRIGLISGDFRQHVVMKFLLPLLKELAKKKINVTLFNSCELDTSHDNANKEARNLCTSYLNIHEKSTKASIQAIREAKIDILIDLSGHTRRNRLDIFNHRAAPVQVTWLGCPATTGAKHMDFILVDDYLNNNALKDICSEEPISKAGPFLCLSRLCESKVTPQTPEERNGYLTFGTINNPRKYTESSIQTWANILLRSKNSKLLITRSEFKSEVTRTNINSEFKKHGIRSDQLILNTPEDGSNFLDSYNNIDIALDTFPYTGTTTTIDSLWMGVPVITLSGTAIHQRASASILYHCGLSEWICSTKDEYIAKAIDLAKEPNLRQQKRTKLRETLTQSGLLNPKEFAEDFLEALHKMTLARLKKIESIA